MDAGMLDVKIELQREAATSAPPLVPSSNPNRELDDAGQPVATKESDDGWITYARRSASREAVRGNENFVGQQRLAEVDTKFKLRFLKGVTAAHRVKCAGKKYDIIEVRQFPGGRPERLEILARTRAE
jgi:SPP1 family predicted phage head-tail adaptor